MRLLIQRNIYVYIYIYQRLAQINVSVGARNRLFQLCPIQAYYTHKRHQTNDLVCVCVVADVLYGGDAETLRHQVRGVQRARDLLQDELRLPGLTARRPTRSGAEANG